MTGPTLLIFALMIAAGCAAILTLLFSALKRRTLINKAMVHSAEKPSLFASLSKAATGFFSATNNEIAEKFIGAGIYNTAIAPYYFLIKYTVGAVGAMIIFALSGESVSLLNKIVMLAVLVFTVIVLPDLYLEMRRRALASKITRQLPYLLDIMGVCVQTGMTIEASIFYLTTEMAAFDKDIAYVLKRLRDRAQTKGLEKALLELNERVPAPEMHSFVMTLTQSMQHGTSIYEALSILAKDIREIQLLSLEEKAGKLSSKMSVPLILFIMMPIVILITAPGIMRMLG